MIPVLDLFDLLTMQMYLYLPIDSIGALHNTCHASRALLKTLVQKDPRIRGVYCPCNICEVLSDPDADRFGMNALLIDPQQILLVCPWYFDILRTQNR